VAGLIFSRPLSLAIPLWVGTRSGSGVGHQWGRNGKFCVEEGPTTRTAGIQA